MTGEFLWTSSLLVSVPHCKSLVSVLYNLLSCNLACRDGILLETEFLSSSLSLYVTVSVISFDVAFDIIMAVSFCS